MSQNINGIIGIQPESQNIKTESRGDGSFDRNLEIAQQKLAKTSRLNTYSRLQELLSNLLPLEMKFSKSFNETPEKENIPYLEKIDDFSAPVKDQKQHQEKYANEVVIIEETEKIKEALMQNIPKFQPTIPGSPLFYSDEAQLSTLTHKNLQLLIDEIVNNAKLIKTQAKTKLELLLNEETLGNILLSISSQKGKVVINIAAFPEAKKLLDKEIKLLEEALERAKIDVEEIKVTEVEKYDPNTAG